MDQRDPEEWLEQIAKEMERLTGEISGAAPKLARSKGWSPRIDVLETEENVVLKAELAGVQPEEVTLHFSSQRQTLTVKGVRHDESLFPQDKQVPLQLEIEYGEFWREVALPDVSLDLEGVRARFDNGIMFVVIPKCAEASPTVILKKTITIKKF